MNISNRLFWAICLMSCCAILSSGRHVGADTDELSARKLTIVDKDGKPRIALQVSDDGQASISFVRPGNANSPMQIIDGDEHTGIRIQRGVLAGNQQAIVIAQSKDDEVARVSIVSPTGTFTDMVSSMAQSQTPTHVGRTGLIAPSEVANCVIIADDGKRLGMINQNKFDTESIADKFGDYGNEFNGDSMFNKFGSYGNKFGMLSPFNKATSTPPKIFRGGTFIAFLTLNESVSPRVDTEALLGWIASGR